MYADIVQDEEVIISPPCCHVDPECNAQVSSFNHIVVAEQLWKNCCHCNSKGAWVFQVAMEDIDVDHPTIHSSRKDPKLLLSSKCFRRGVDIAHHPLANGCDDNWTWDLKAKSHEVCLYGPKRRIAHFHPNWSNGTAGVRGTRVLNNGRYYWELNVSQRIFGTR